MWTAFSWCWRNNRQFWLLTLALQLGGVKIEENNDVKELLVNRKVMPTGDINWRDASVFKRCMWTRNRTWLRKEHLMGPMNMELSLQVWRGWWGRWDADSTTKHWLLFRTPNCCCRATHPPLKCESSILNGQTLFHFTSGTPSGGSTMFMMSLINRYFKTRSLTYWLELYYKKRSYSRIWRSFLADDYEEIEQTKLGWVQMEIQNILAFPPLSSWDWGMRWLQSTKASDYCRWWCRTRNTAHWRESGKSWEFKLKVHIVHWNVRKSWYFNLVAVPIRDHDRGNGLQAVNDQPVDLVEQLVARLIWFAIIGGFSVNIWKCACLPRDISR